MSHLDRKQVRAKVRRRIRKKLSGTAVRPRLAVHFSNQNVYAQLIDDEAGQTLAAASTAEKGAKATGASKDSATKIGELIAKRGQEAKVSEVVFDRGGFIFHGKVKALADAAREGGLKF